MITLWYRFFWFIPVNHIYLDNWQAFECVEWVIWLGIASVLLSYNKYSGKATNLERTWPWHSWCQYVHTWSTNTVALCRLLCAQFMQDWYTERLAFHVLPFFWSHGTKGWREDGGRITLAFHSFHFIPNFSLMNEMTDHKVHHHPQLIHFYHILLPIANHYLSSIVLFE